jgi:hypothetical protein
MLPFRNGGFRSLAGEVRWTMRLTHPAAISYDSPPTRLGDGASPSDAGVVRVFGIRIRSERWSGLLQMCGGGESRALQAPFTSREVGQMRVRGSLDVCSFRSRSKHRRQFDHASRLHDRSGRAAHTRRLRGAPRTPSGPHFDLRIYRACFACGLRVAVRYLPNNWINVLCQELFQKTRRSGYCPSNYTVRFGIGLWWSCE